MENAQTEKKFRQINMWLYPLIRPNTEKFE